MQTSTSGGRSDTEQKALAVMPCTSPLAVSTVMTVTPVAKRPRAALNSSGVTKFVMRCRSGAKLDPEANIPDWSRLDPPPAHLSGTEEPPQETLSLALSFGVKFWASPGLDPLQRRVIPVVVGCRVSSYGTRVALQLLPFITRVWFRHHDHL